MKVLFVLNPSSGNAGNDKAILRIHELAVEKEFDFKFLYTNGRNDDERIANDLALYKPDRVIAGGGDGTIQLVARNLVGKNLLMGIIPLGSANGMATALGIPANPVEAVSTIVTAEHFIPLDLLRFNDNHLSIHLGDIGINALMVKKYEEDSQKGMLGYAKYLLSSIKESPLLKYSIKTPEQVYEREGYMLAFANAHQYGTGVHISQGEVWDGKFEIVNVPRVALDQIIKAGLTALNVFVDKNMFSDVISCTKAEVTIDREVDFQIDGEYMGKVKSLKVEIVPSAIKLLIP
ncbi:MAG TPA: diacylglycerol kinase family protein [Chryseosolibacter sp.]